MGFFIHLHLQKLQLLKLVSDEHIQKVWKNLKTAYSRNFRNNNGLPTYYRVAQMNFLDPYIPLDIREEVEVLAMKNRKIRNEIQIVSDRIEKIRNSELRPVILTLEDIIRHDHHYNKLDVGDE